MGLICEDFTSMPGKVRGFRTECYLSREGEWAAVEIGEFEVAAPGKDGFGDVRLGHADAEVVIDGPEAGVEEIVGGRGKG